MMFVSKHHHWSGLLLFRADGNEAPFHRLEGNVSLVSCYMLFY